MKRNHYPLAAFPFAYGLVFTIACEIIMRVAVSKESTASAIAESFGMAFGQPAGLLFVLSPFLVLTAIAFILIARKKHLFAGLFIGLALPLLSVLYCFGYYGSQVSLREGAWTAAALSVGLLPFLSVPALLLAAVIAALILLCMRFAGRKRTVSVINKNE